jgi:peptide/nickel transport system permease protein
MVAFIIRRFLGMIVVLFVVSLFVFLIFIVVPGGDPAVRIAGRTATDQNIENIRKDWGFDQPFYVQYYDMMKKAFTNDLYEQTHQGVSVVDQIKQGVPATFSLAIGAALIWLTFGILVGVLSAIAAGKASDRLITLLALIGISMPVFWLGLLARYFLAEKHTIFPDGGYVPLTENPA